VTVPRSSSDAVAAVIVRELLASVVIGDGIIALAIPRRHTRRWVGGPAPWRELMSFLAARPGLKRALSVAQVGVGLAYALRLPPR
jgi:hypothetical protein